MDFEQETLSPEASLNEREAALIKKERALRAREELTARRLPGEWQALINLDSDEALEKSLDLAEQLYKKAQSAPAENQVPRAWKPDPKQMTKMNYRQRAALYQQDRQAYAQACGEADRWTSR